MELVSSNSYLSHDLPELMAHFGSSFLGTRAFASGPNPAEPLGPYGENDGDQGSPFCILLGRDG